MGRPTSRDARSSPSIRWPRGTRGNWLPIGPTCWWWWVRIRSPWRSPTPASTCAASSVRTPRNTCRSHRNHPSGALSPGGKSGGRRCCYSPPWRGWRGPDGDVDVHPRLLRPSRSRWGPMIVPWPHSIVSIGWRCRRPASPVERRCSRWRFFGTISPTASRRLRSRTPAPSCCRPWPRMAAYHTAHCVRWCCVRMP
jgi:hypothetical protein